MVLSGSGPGLRLSKVGRRRTQAALGARGRLAVPLVPERLGRIEGGEAEEIEVLARGGAWSVTARCSCVTDLEDADCAARGVVELVGHEGVRAGLGGGELHEAALCRCEVEGL